MDVEAPVWTYKELEADMDAVCYCHEMARKANEMGAPEIAAYYERDAKLWLQKWEKITSWP